MNVNFSDKKACINGTEYHQLHTKKSYCPKCHPYIAGCIVVLIFLFTVYHRKQIESFFTSIFDINTTESAGASPMNATESAAPSKLLAVTTNATAQHFTAAINCGNQPTIGLCIVLITIVINVFSSFMWK